MSLYRAPGCAVQDEPAVACRCCPGGLTRSTRRRPYPSDMTAAEWAVFEPVLPPPAWLAGRGGRPAGYCLRDVVDAIRYLTHNGPVWRALPADFPPAWTVYYWARKCRRTARPRGCMMTCANGSAWWLGAAPLPRRPSSIRSR